MTDSMYDNHILNINSMVYCNIGYSNADSAGQTNIFAMEMKPYVESDKEVKEDIQHEKKIFFEIICIADFARFLL